MQRHITTRLADWLLILLVIFSLFSGIRIAAAFWPPKAFGANGEGANVAQGVAEGYRYDRQTVVYRSGLATADVIADVGTAVTEFRALGRQNISVSGRFSVASQTCVVRLFAFYEDVNGTETFLGHSSDVQLNGPSTLFGGKYVAPTFVFDSYGGNVVRIALVTAPVSGNVDFWAGSY
jgi:hypothetical protein